MSGPTRCKRRVVSWALGAALTLAGCRESSKVPNTEPLPAPPLRNSPGNREPGRFETTAQLVVVITDGWNEKRGELFRFERKRGDVAFEPIGDREVVVLGRAGLGEGIGLIALPFKDAPRKNEGDGRAPAGLFRLESAFGETPTLETNLPYRQMTSDHICVDDPNDENYGRIVRPGSSRPKSFERMRRSDALYRIGVTIGHNEKHELGRGSCIFLHVWRSPESSTIGCTALPLETLAPLVRWLDDSKKPLLLQLPRTERESLAVVARELEFPVGRLDAR